jgi:hypothetical protein
MVEHWAAATQLQVAEHEETGPQLQMAAEMYNITFFYMKESSRHETFTFSTKTDL